MCARSRNADDADRHWPRLDSPLADRPSTHAQRIETTQSAGSQTGRHFLPRIVLPWAKTSELSANARLHWVKRNRLVKKQRAETHIIALEAGWHLVHIPQGATVHYTLTFCLPSRVKHADDDNVITANKGARDSLADVLGIDDRAFKLAGIREGERCKDGAIIIEAELV